MTDEGPSPSWGLNPGDRIDDELTAARLLGGGSAYEAWVAFDEVTYGPVVVKLVRPDQVEDRATLRTLRRELELLQRVRHPVVVRALRARLEADRPLLVLEHIDGPRLSTLVRRYGALEPAQYLPLGIDVAAALHLFGREGLVHLDVKPSNIIMGAPARLIDLSVARSVEDAAGLTYAVGTDRYMAPEQCDPPSTGTPGPAADIWGLGATLFEAISGQRPFPRGEREGAPEMRFPQLVQEPAPLPPRVPAEVAKVVLACLSPRPEDRPRPAEVVDALSPVLEQQPRGRLGGFKSALQR